MPTAEETKPIKSRKGIGGRPSKYNQDIVRKAEEYLNEYESYGDVIPSIAALALELDLNVETITNWANDKNKKEFSRVVRRLRQTQERKLLDGGLNSKFNSGITKLVLSKHGYHDNPQGNQGSSGITVQVNRSGVVLKSGNQELEIQTDQSPGKVIEHD